tara:strand:- start:374 stop:817 length:444 start_codon:yes stop_codon:yes gene_type:complete
MTIVKESILKSLEIPLQEQLKQLNNLNEDYKKGLIKKYDKYLLKYNRIKNLNSLSNKIKRFGAKVIKDNCSGYYIYKGVNFNAKFNQESCENTWWEVNTYLENTHKRVEKEFQDFNKFYTKKECLNALFLLDLELSSEETIDFLTNI